MWGIVIISLCIYKQTPTYKYGQRQQTLEKYKEKRMALCYSFPSSVYRKVTESAFAIWLHQTATTTTKGITNNKQQASMASTDMPKKDTNTNNTNIKKNKQQDATFVFYKRQASARIRPQAPNTTKLYIFIHIHIYTYMYIFIIYVYILLFCFFFVVFICGDVFEFIERSCGCAWYYFCKRVG